MRLSLFALLAVIAVAMACIGLASAEEAGKIPSRRLKGTQTETDLTASEEERAGWQDALAKVKASGQLGQTAEKLAGGNKWQQALEKMKAAGKVDDVAAGTTANANKWQGAFTKLKESGALNKASTVTKGQTVSQNKWQAAVSKMQAGGKLNALDETNNKWQGALAKMKASGQLKNVDDTQVAKLAEGAAAELVKNPKKSGAFKKLLEVTFGVGFTALIVMAFYAMIS